MKITIRKPGLLTTVQDMGRRHYLSQAVPLSGAMDSLSARIANCCLGNDVNNAVIEFTQSGASFVADDDLLLAFSGGGAYLTANRGRLPADRPVFVPAGTLLSLENSSIGCRSYLAVAGGWDVPEVLGSRSTFLAANIGGLNGRSLQQGDRPRGKGICDSLTESIYRKLKGDTISYSSWSIARQLFLPQDQLRIRVIKGREFTWFDQRSNDAFLSQSFTVGNNSNRMGVHLKGLPLKRKVGGELLSTGAAPGTIQVTNDGGLILLMADCQTTGGYPRAAQVAAVDLPLCAQLKAGDAIRFSEISWKEAEFLYLKQQHDLRKLALSVKLRLMS